MRKFPPLLALLVMFTACGDFIGIGDSIAGTYTLVSVGGNPVRVSLVGDVTGRVTVTAGSV